MRTAKLAMYLMAAALVAGCIPSLHPLYTEDDLVFEPGLVGTWAGTSEDGRWAFEQAAPKAYNVTFVQEGKPGRFEGHLLRIGEQLFLDLYPEQPEIDANDYYKMHLVPAHTFLRVSLAGDALSIRVMNYEWLGTLLEKDPKAVAHERIEEGMVVLTAAPKELQAFLRKHLEDKDAFDDAGEYRRVGTERATKDAVRESPPED